MEQQLRTEISQLIGKLPESQLKLILAYLKEIEKSSKENTELMTHLDKIFEEDAGLLKKLAQ